MKHQKGDQYSVIWLIKYKDVYIVYTQNLKQNMYV